MAKNHVVTLASNGKYWMARYYDSLGRRKGKALGPKATLGKRQALILCERFAVELHGHPARADVSRAPTLAAWAQSFFALKPELSDKAKRAYLIAVSKFMAFAGEHTRIDRITPATAADWLAKLSSPIDTKSPEEGSTRTLSPATIAHYCRHVRCMLNEAVHQGVLISNPFARIRTQPRRINRTWHYVPRELFSRVLDACPSDGWRCFLALQRIGGLRKGEALAVEWRMVDFKQRTLTLPETITKTGQERIVPLDPELYDLLDRCRGTGLVVPQGDVDRDSDSNQHHRFRTLLKRVKVTVWEDLFQTLRRNAVQDLRNVLKDPWAVTAIAGHSEEVERKYYLGRVRQGDMDRITQTGSDGHTTELLDLWSQLSEENRSKLLAMLRAAIVRSKTGTKTGTRRAVTVPQIDDGQQKEPGVSSSDRSAPRRTRTFDPLIKSEAA